MFTTRTRTLVAIGTLVAMTVSAGMLTSAAAPRFMHDDPLWVDRDTQDASRIAPLEVSLTVDVAYNVIRGFRAPANVRAQNVNSIDEVPDSSWYTNRAGRLPLTPADIVTGPNRHAGPAAGPWTISSSKSDGVTPGFTIKDATGQRWFLKFDPPGYRGMATGTEVAVTKLMWALGYNVPENHVASLTRERLVLSESATFTPPGGRARPMRPADVDALLARADREPDGSYRVVASRALDGTPVGRIRFSDTRPDDPNDIVPHQHRRELRGYGVFAAWVDHVDAKSINSLDTLVTRDGRSIVQHHLIDFGSTLGSGGVAPSDYWEGAEYLIAPARVARQMIGFGVKAAPWQRTTYYESPAIGRLPARNAEFDPRQWKPRVPNQAFMHARPDDEFWAARKLMALSADMIRAAVGTGQFDNVEAEAFLVRALVERRDAIARAYLTGVNPISDPQLSRDGRLTFRNAAVDADVARAPREYRATWSTFDNATGASRAIGESAAIEPAMAAPVELPATDGAFLKLALSSHGSAHDSWSVPVDAYFRLRGGDWQLVGFERMPDR